MATDLVRWSRGDRTDESVGQEDAEQIWDLPPVQPQQLGTARLGRRNWDRKAAKRADQDAAIARERGDAAFAVARETDASEQRQNAWDWGDARTWLIIAGMCLLYLAFCLFVYVLPYGRHNQNDGPVSTTPARYY